METVPAAATTGQEAGLGEATEMAVRVLDLPATAVEGMEGIDP